MAYSNDISTQLFLAARGAKSLKRFTFSDPSFSLEQAYETQERLLRHHLVDGEKLVGYKMGMTSLAKMQQMGIHSPIHGFLTDKMQLKDKGELSLTGRIHPKVEPEIAFILNKPLSGAPSLEEALAAVESVCVALEIIDSRFENFDFQLPDVVADNCSSSGFVLGTKRLVCADLDLTNISIELSANGKILQTGSSAAILGNPGKSLAELARLLSARGASLPAGAIVLAGGATAAIKLEPGAHISVQAGALGSAEFQVSK